MKILVIVDSYPPYHSGGYEIRCRDVVENLRKFGHEIIILTTIPPKFEPYFINNIYRKLHKKNYKKTIINQIFHDYQDIKFLDSTIQRFNPDIIYLWHLINLSSAIIPYLSKKKYPIVYDEGGNGIQTFIKNEKNYLYFYYNKNDSIFKKEIKILFSILIQTLSNGLIPRKWSWPNNFFINFNNHYSLKLVEDKIGSHAKTSLIYPGIDLTKFLFEEKEELRFPVKIIVPGRIAEVKGIKEAINLVQFLNENGIHSILQIVGKITSEEYYSESLRYIRHHKLEEIVEILPMANQEILNNHYQESDICFFPSKQKIGLSRVPLEAMACGCVVITYGNEGAIKIIRNNFSGFIVNYFNDSKEIITLLLNNPEFYKKIMISARHEIEKKYELNKYVRSIEFFLSNVVNSSYES